MKRSHLFAVATALFCATALLPTLTLAQDTPRFFQKVAADASTSKSLEEIRGSFIFIEGGLTAESITLDELPATELVQKVPYEVLTPSDWPGAYVQPATFGHLQPQNTVIAIYDVTQPEGESIEFWFSQQPEETAGLPILIGASAQIETVSVGETTGEWVEGGWSGPDSSLTWDNVGDSTLVWQQNGFVFMVQAFDTVELDTLLKHCEQFAAARAPLAPPLNRSVLRVSPQPLKLPLEGVWKCFYLPLNKGERGGFAFVKTSTAHLTEENPPNPLIKGASADASDFLNTF